jgi:hypothetical protein
MRDKIIEYLVLAGMFFLVLVGSQMIAVLVGGL